MIISVRIITMIWCIFGMLSAISHKEGSVIEDVASKSTPISGDQRSPFALDIIRRSMLRRRKKKLGSRSKFFQIYKQNGIDFEIISPLRGFPNVKRFNKGARTNLRFHLC